MVVATRQGGQNSAYRCPQTGDCQRRASINASIVEPIVVEAVRTALANVEGSASMADRAREAEAELERAQAELDAAIRSFASAGLQDEQAATDRLAELREARDGAEERVDHLAPQRTRSSSTLLPTGTASLSRSAAH